MKTETLEDIARDEFSTLIDNLGFEERRHYWYRTTWYDARNPNTTATFLTSGDFGTRIHVFNEGETKLISKAGINPVSKQNYDSGSFQKLLDEAFPFEYKTYRRNISAVVAGIGFVANVAFSGRGASLFDPVADAGLAIGAVAAGYFYGRHLDREKYRNAMRSREINLQRYLRQPFDNGSVNPFDVKLIERVYSHELQPR